MSLTSESERKTQIESMQYSALKIAQKRKISTEHRISGLLNNSPLLLLGQISYCDQLTFLSDLANCELTRLDPFWPEKLAVDN